jgi:hypothetical protein
MVLRFDGAPFTNQGFTRRLGSIMAGMSDDEPSASLLGYSVSITYCRDRYGLSAPDVFPAERHPIAQRSGLT